MNGVLRILYAGLADVDVGQATFGDAIVFFGQEPVAIQATGYTALPRASRVVDGSVLDVRKRTVSSLP